MASSEDQEFRVGRGIRIELTRDEVDRVEKYHEGEQKAQIAPDVAVGVPVGGLHPPIARHCGLSCDSAGYRTLEGAASTVRWHQAGRSARIVDSVNFVDEKGLECVRHRIDP